MRRQLCSGIVALTVLGYALPAQAATGSTLPPATRYRTLPKFETPAQRLRRLRYDYLMHQQEMARKKAEEERLARLQAAEQDAQARALALAEEEKVRAAEKLLRENRLAVLRLVNAERDKAGLLPVLLDPVLNTSAQRYAEDMVTRSFFSHETPEGVTFEQRMLSLNYVGRMATCACHRDFGAGENLAFGQRSADEAVQDWMLSKNHKANILEPFFTRIGVGWKDNKWVQHFVGVRERPLPPSK